METARTSSFLVGHHTPNGVANIMSEPREVNVRKTRLEWCPGMARQFHTAAGASIPLIMGSNGLGFLTIQPPTDHRRIIKLLKRSTLTPPWLLEQIHKQHPAPAVLTSSVPPLDTVAPSLTSVDQSDTMAQSHLIDMPFTVQLCPPAHAIECLRMPDPVEMAAPALARQLVGASTTNDAAMLARSRVALACSPSRFARFLGQSLTKAR